MQKILAFLTIAVLVMVLGSRPATAAGFGLHSSAVGACKQRDCTAALFVAETDKPRLLMFNREGQLIGSMSAPSPVSMLATDSQGRLYVSGNFSDASLLIYSPPLYNTPTKIKVPAGKTAGGLSVDARSGRFAVVSGVDGDGEEIQIYAPNSTTPCATVHQPSNADFGGVGTFDREGTLYVFASTSNGLDVASIPGGCNAHTVQELTFGPSYHLTNYMQFNGNDDLVVQSYVGTPNTAEMYTFHHPHNGQFGKPIAITRLQNTVSGITYELFNGFVADGKHAWGTGYRTLSLYNYPAGGLPILTLRGDVFTLCYMAVVPPLQP